MGWRSLGEQSLKGLSEPLAVWEWHPGGAVPERLRERPPALPDRPSLVVLPFRQLGPESCDLNLAEGMRLDIQNALVQVSGLFIIAHGSASAMAEATTEAACRHLGVRYALEGCVHRIGARVRIGVSLVEGASGWMLWAETFDRKLEDAFALIDDITGRVLTALNVALVAGKSARVWHRTLRDLKSLRLFYQGFYEFSQMTPASMRRARARFEALEAAHPDAAIGPTWIALSHWFELQRGRAENAAAARDLMRRAAERGAAKEDADGQAHTVLSHAYLLDGRFEDALDAGRTSVANRPNCTLANGFYANVLHHCGEHDAAIRHADLAMRYAPLYPPLFKEVCAMAHWARGERDDALAAAREALAVAPASLTARLVALLAARESGDVEGARGMATEIRALDPAFTAADFSARHCYRDAAFAGRVSRALSEAGF